MAKESLREVLFASALVVLSAASASACVPSYVVQPGDTLFSLAEEQMGDPTKWSRIFYENPQLSSSSAALRPGSLLRIPCPEELVTRAAPPALAPSQGGGLRFVARSDFAPFADRNWPNQGMLTEMLRASLAAGADATPYDILWDARAADFADVAAQTIDMGFPAFRPACEMMPQSEACQQFHFSDSLVDVVMLLFARTESGFVFEADTDLIGKTLCRPEALPVDDLDRPGRSFLSEQKLDLLRPETTAECFDLLMAGGVDAVAVDEFTGVQAMFSMGLQDAVTPMPRALSVEGLHVVISKTHWQGTTQMFRLNDGLRLLKETPEYDAIVNRHLAYFWESLEQN